MYLYMHARDDELNFKIYPYMHEHRVLPNSTNKFGWVIVGMTKVKGYQRS